MIYEDTRQQRNKHSLKHEWWKSHNVKLVRKKLDFGDYATDVSNISVDTKRSITEIAQNISRDHRRFRDECERAKNDGYRLIILVEHTERVRNLRDLLTWTNEQCRYCAHYRRRGCNPGDTSTKCARHGTVKPIQGKRLAKAMATMSAKYGVVFEFCAPDESAQRICELLGIDYKDGGD